MPRGTPNNSAVLKPTAAIVKHHRDISNDYVDALLKYADVFYKAGMFPKIKDAPARPETIAAIIEVGRDVGLPSTQALAYIMIVNGKPTIWGDAAIALVRASGLIEENYPQESFLGVPGEDDYRASYKIKRKGCPERISEFSIEDARTAGLLEKKGPWQQYRKRQMMWRAKGFALRDEFPDVLCGLVITEEAFDWPESGRVTVIDVKPSEPIEEDPTDEQFDKLTELRQALITGRGLKDDAEIKEAWLEILKPFGVSTANNLTRKQAGELIESLGKQHDPFEFPPSPAVAKS